MLKWIFVAYDGEQMYTYVYSKYTVDGPNCIFISKMKQPYSSLPMLVYKGVLVFIDAGGKIIQLKLETHTHDTNVDDLTQEQLVERMRKNYRLKRFDEAYIYASRITNRHELIEFGKAALHHLEIEQAIRVFRLCTAPDMVFALNSIKVGTLFFLLIKQIQSN